MLTIEYWGLLAIASAIGAALGSVVTLRIARARFAAELRQATDELKRRHASTTAELRSARGRVNNELELARLSFKRQLASAGEGPRAAVLEAEERLRAAYDAMERLRRASPARAASKPDFATTEILAESKSSNRANAAPTSAFASIEVMDEKN